MVQSDIGRIADLVRWLFVGRFVVVDNISDEFPTFAVVAYEDSFFVLGDHFAPSAELADIGGLDEILDVPNLPIDITPIFLIEFLGLAVFVGLGVGCLGTFFTGRGLDFEEGVDDITRLFRGLLVGSRNLLFLFEIVEDISGVVEEILFLFLF